MMRTIAEITNLDYIEKLREVRARMSIAARLEQLAEESTELTHAALKMARIIRNESPTNVTMKEAEDNLCEEIGDVLCCLDAVNMDSTKVAKMAKEKAGRWSARLKAENPILTNHEAIFDSSTTTAKWLCDNLDCMNCPTHENCRYAEGLKDWLEEDSE